MNQFKVGDWVNFRGGTTYEIVDSNNDVLCIKSKDGAKFRMAKPEELTPLVPVHPELTDFQKLRLETAVQISIHTDITEFSEALHDADMMINLVLNTPFKQTT